MTKKQIQKMRTNWYYNHVVEALTEGINDYLENYDDWNTYLNFLEESLDDEEDNE